MSEFTKDLEAFGKRLGADGYPTALIERAVERMEEMEEIIVEMNSEIKALNDWMD